MLEESITFIKPMSEKWRNNKQVKYKKKEEKKKQEIVNLYTCM
jgi:hypothetical protein